MSIKLSMHFRENLLEHKTFWLDLVFITGLALTIRLVWALAAAAVDPFLQQTPFHGDAAAYDRIARSLILGTGFTERPPELSAFWPPLYPLFLSFVYRVGDYSLLFVRLLQAVMGALVSTCFYLILYRAMGRAVALLTALGLLLYPYLIYFGAWIIAEALFLALFSLAMYFTAQLSQQAEVKTVVGAGLFFGLATLAKPTTLFFMPFIALWLFAAPYSKSIWKRISSVLLLAIVTLLVILPWTIRNYLIYEQVVLVSTNGGYTFLGANNPNAWGGHDEGYPPSIPGLNDAEMEDAYYAEALAWIREKPSDFLKLLVPKFQRLLSPLSVASFREDYPLPGAPLIYAVYYSYLLLALVGMVLGIKHWRKIGFLYAPIVGVLLSTGLFYGDARYTIPMVPSLVAFTALAIVVGWNRVQSKTL